MKKVIGFASDLGGVFKDRGDSAAYFLEKYPLEDTEILFPLALGESFQTIAEICTRLAEKTYHAVKNKQFFNVIGGDHSSAIGTWSGVHAALNPQEDLGLIWIDAHLDSHTPQTSLSGNIHGMPVATLLGYGNPHLIQIKTSLAKIKPENLCFIGIRSYETAEEKFIQHLNIKTYFIDEIHDRGLETVFQEAQAQVSRQGMKYGISLDLDSIDPLDVPGVSTPEPKGLAASELLNLFTKYALPHKKNQQLLGLEIAEFNRYFDIDNKTELLILEILDIL